MNQPLLYHVPKDSLRKGSTLAADPPWPSVDVVTRVEYEGVFDAVRGDAYLWAIGELDAEAAIRAIAATLGLPSGEKKPR